MVDTYLPEGTPIWGDDTDIPVDRLLDDIEEQIASMHLGTAATMIMQFEEFRQGWTYKPNQREKLDSLHVQLDKFNVMLP